MKTRVKVVCRVCASTLPRVAQTPCCAKCWEAAPTVSKTEYWASRADAMSAPNVQRAIAVAETKLILAVRGFR